jgi:hypothetical protein
MNVVHESSNLSETSETNMVSHTTTFPLPQCETRAEGNTLLYLRQKLSACKLVPGAPKVERRFCKAEAQGSIPCGHIVTSSRADVTLICYVRQQGGLPCMRCTGNRASSPHKRMNKMR